MADCDVCPKHSGIEARLDAVCHKLDEREKLVNSKFEAMDLAIQTAKDVMEHRLVSLNELRAEVTRDREQFVRVETYNIKTTAYDAWVADTSRRVTVIETRSVVWTAALGIFFVLLQIAVHFLK